MRRALWKRLLRLRFHLFQRHRYDRLVLERVGGRSFLVLPQVFNPQLFVSGQFLIETLLRAGLPPDATVLDMGTGSGLGAVLVAPHAGRVVAVDINPAAVRCARINVLLNTVETTVEVREGNLFAPVMGEKFDIILFNPPYFRGTPQSALDHAWRSVDTVERFGAGLCHHLAPQGHALVVLSSDGDAPTFLRAFQAQGLAVRVEAERELRNERLTVYRLQPQTKDDPRFTIENTKQQKGEGRNGSNGTHNLLSSLLPLLSSNHQTT